MIVSQGGCQGGKKSDDVNKIIGDRTSESTMRITSSAFEDGGKIPIRYTCDGEDVSPPLKWEEPPEGAAAFALICDDPDAPVGVWVHWVIYDLPADKRELIEGIPDLSELDDGTRQGRNDFKRIGYDGPCPPRGKPHRYFFKLYALDALTGLDAGATKAELLSAIEGHILAESLLFGIYKRK